MEPGLHHVLLVVLLVISTDCQGQTELNLASIYALSPMLYYIQILMYEYNFSDVVHVFMCFSFLHSVQ